jgi:hypothetical protein
VHIEVHHSLNELPAQDVWARAETVPGQPGLCRPAPLDQLWHALVHATYSHPFRRGALRDLLLIGWADASVPAESRSALDARLRANPQREGLLRAVLNLAREIRDDRAAVDLFRREAAAHYLLSRSLAPFGESGLRPHVVQAVYARLDGGSTQRDFWYSVWTGRDHESPWSLLARVEATWPWAGRWLRRVLRMLRLPLVEMNAVPIVRRAERLARAHGTMEAKTLVMRSGEP